MENRKSFFSAKTVVAAWSLTMSLAASAEAQAPIETVPWNGHVGAASFTFDDALENQV